MKTFKEYVSESIDNEIHAFDIDDTLVFTDAKIHYTEPGQKKKSVFTREFAKMRDNLHPDTAFDFSEFSEFDNCYMSIVKGTPNIPVLRMMDRVIESGGKIGIITARSNQAAVLAAIKDKILFKDKSGNLKKVPRVQLRKKFVFAVGDPNTSKSLGIKGGSINPSMLKAYVFKNIFADKMGFRTVHFYDDDQKNIDSVKLLNDPRIVVHKI